jgi:hypothetical protein
MKLFSAVLVAALAVVSSACDSDSPTAPGLATSFTFTATLLPSNEIPAVVGAEAAGSGTVTITMPVTRDSAGSITAATATFVVNLTGFPAGTTLTGAHLHQAVAGATAAVIVNTTLGNGEVVLTNGAGTFTKSSINVPVDTANAMIATPSGFYFNVHTTLNPGGAARGQLVKQ